MGANSGQVHEVFDGPGQLNPSPPGTIIVIGGNNVTLGRYLWSGRNGEYYEVPGRWPGWEGEVIVKKFYIWYYPDHIAREVKNLSKVGQFLAQEEYEGFQWLIMHKPPGVHLTKTRAFKEAFKKGRKECDDLVEDAYGPAFKVMMEYIAKHGLYHELNNARMLWDDFAQNPSIFDIGDDEECDPSDAEKDRIKKQVALSIYFTWPNDGVSYQDWCVNGQSQ
ncbi:hypothetical protein BU17DRAFT_88914 [Hysterangium stoloniferum]|nr:hypothetical protein BU17DRAFT_88914 [Hysterangium stoloniferum]